MEQKGGDKFESYWDRRIWKLLRQKLETDEQNAQKTLENLGQMESQKL